MVGPTVYDATMTAVHSVTPQDYGGGGSAITPDGAAAYFATWYGYQKIRLSDGFVLEQVKLPVSPAYLLVFPDGNDTDRRRLTSGQYHG